MASATTDIVARLQLRAEQFSSEGGRAFAELTQRARTAAQGVRQEFNSSFAEVQRLAQRSLTLPRTTGGSLDLSSEIASLKEAAAAAEQRAIAARETGEAMQRAAFGTTAATEAALRDADASLLAAHASQADAAAIGQRIVQLEAYQAELGRTASATVDVAAAAEREASAQRAAAEQAAQARRSATLAYERFEARVRQGAQAMREAAIEEDRLTAVATRLRGEIDPLSASQARFNRELIDARAAFAAGKLGATELAEAETLIATRSRQAEEAIKRGIATSGAGRAGYQQLGFQLNDVAVGYAAGTKASVIFAQQSGQVVQALSLIAGEAKGVLGFLGGPWGIAISSALIVLSPFVGKLLEGNDALGDAVDKLKKDAEQTEATRRAKEAFAGTAEGVAAAIREGTDATRKSIDASKDSAEQANVEAKQNLEKELSIRRVTLAQLEQAKMLAEQAEPGATGGGPNGASAAVAAQYEARVGELQRKAAEQQAAIGAAEARVQQTRIDLATEAAKRAIDPMAGIKKVYDDQATAARKAAREHGAVTAALTAQLTQIEKNRAAAEKTERDRQSAASRSTAANRQNGRPITSSEAASIVRGIGGQVNSADRSYAKQAALYTAWIRAGKPSNNPVAKPGTSAHEMGNALDVQMGNGMTLAKLRAAFQAEGVQLTKGFAEQGHWHIEWTKSGAAAHELAQGIRDAEQEQRKLTAALDDVYSKFDPATEAARRYAKELGEIDTLVAKGKLSFGEGERLKFQPVVAESEQRTQSHLDAILQREDADFEADWSDLVNRSQVAQQRVVDAWMTAGDAFRQGAAVLTDLLGIRVRGPAAALLRPGGIEGQSHDTARVLVDSFTRGLKLDDATIEKWTAKVGTVLGNASYGQIGGSAFASITGGKSSKLGSSIGGAIGGEVGKLAGPALGKALSGVLGPSLGKALGSIAGPLGAIAGGVLGSVLGGLFKKKSPSGSADITGIDASGVKTSGKLGSSLGTDATSVQKGLTQIAQQLGAVTGAFSVAIGRSGDWFHVAGQAGADVSAAHPTSALLYEGKDEGAAVQAAILDALKDGAIKGISEASQRILKSGQDLDAALQKALAIEAVPRDLKAMLDPVGAAIDELNRKWKATVDALKEGGASAEQMAQAERLYNLQLDQTKNSTSSASQALKDFMTSLKLGSSSPYSLRDQEGTARTQLQPYLDQITAGQSIDQSKYQSAANAFLDIERQLYGSTQAYFDALDTVQAATNKAISTIDNAEPITTAVADPFTKATAESAAKTATGVQTSNELLSQLSDQMGSLQQTLAALGGSGSGGGGGGSTFIGSPRLFGLAS